MSHTVHLFAHNGVTFAERWHTTPNKIVSEVAAWAESARIPQNDLRFGLDCVRELSASEPLTNATEDHFYAFCWIGDSVMERIHVPEFAELQSFRYIDEYGILPGLLAHSAPFPLPRAAKAPPVAGYLPWNEMSRYEFSERMRSEKLAFVPTIPILTPAQVTYARQQFLYVLETLVEDELDLLAIII